ncbi:hypothetical protein MBEHAL_2211 [Halarchaeum acidiphilum MH1-52-1]|uniref:Uncharacterized protein n=1 Tax=Halarchaeum acidiphilum MH1-52-1 TaxID=1261545 RepID=U2YGL6_9EURY|nr:hypothetical protein MBEHAL_2211 [Halarchaeum acidiphilum MH1-52-1]
MLSQLVCTHTETVEWARLVAPGGVGYHRIRRRPPGGTGSIAGRRKHFVSRPGTTGCVP